MHKMFYTNDFSHLIELKYIYITEIYIKKNNTDHPELRIIKSQKKYFDDVPLKRLHSLLSYF